MATIAAPLLHRAALVELAGEDAGAFAHAQFASDVAGLAPGSAQWSAWLDAQGRVRNLFALARIDPQRLLAWLPLGDAAGMAAALGRYVLRSRLRVRALEEHAYSTVAAGKGTPAVVVRDDGIELALPALPAWRLHFRGIPSDAGPVIDALPSALAAAGIEAGLAWLDGGLEGGFTGAALDLGRIGATRIDKGCYPGQEIVARLHYRGGNKRHCRRLRIDGRGETPAPGTRLIRTGDAAGSDCGRILYAAPHDDGATRALAVVDEAALTGPLHLPDGREVAVLPALANAPH